MPCGNTRLSTKVEREVETNMEMAGEARRNYKSDGTAAILYEREKALGRD